MLRCPSMGFLVSSTRGKGFSAHSGARLWGFSGLWCPFMGSRSEISRHLASASSFNSHVWTLDRPVSPTRGHLTGLLLPWKDTFAMHSDTVSPMNPLFGTTHWLLPHSRWLPVPIGGHLSALKASRSKGFSSVNEVKWGFNVY